MLSGTELLLLAKEVFHTMGPQHFPWSLTADITRKRLPTDKTRDCDLVSIALNNFMFFFLIFYLAKG